MRTLKDAWKNLVSNLVFAFYTKFFHAKMRTLISMYNA